MLLKVVISISPKSQQRFLIPSKIPTETSTLRSLKKKHQFSSKKLTLTQPKLVASQELLPLITQSLQNHLQLEAMCQPDLSTTTRINSTPPKQTSMPQKNTLNTNTTTESSTSTKRLSTRTIIKMTARRKKKRKTPLSSIQRSTSIKRKRMKNLQELLRKR